VSKEGGSATGIVGSAATTGEELAVGVDDAAAVRPIAVLVSRVGDGLGVAPEPILNETEQPATRSVAETRGNHLTRALLGERINLSS
jgi:hypothetical protein